jgi:hypothetical protein
VVEVGATPEPFPSDPPAIQNEVLGHETAVREKEPGA